MAVSLRYYLFPDVGDPQRLAKRVVEGLIRGTDSMPRYAGTRQKVVEVVLENTDGKPERIRDAYGVYWFFDDKGGIGESLREALASAWEGMVPRATGAEEKVVDLTARLTKKKAREKHRWKPSTEDLDRIASDLWPNDPTKPRLKAAPGTSAKPPRLTTAARHALGEASEPFWRISHSIDNLTEPGQAGFAYEARRLADSGEEGEFAPLYRGIAELAERQLENVRRRKSGKGTWYAFVEVLRWSGPPRMAETIATYHRRCDSQKAAVAAARELLKKHADKFDDDITIEAEVATDLEWEVMAHDSIADE